MKLQKLQKIISISTFHIWLVAHFIRVHSPSHAFFQIAVITQHPNKPQLLCCKDKTMWLWAVKIQHDFSDHTTCEVRPICLPYLSEVKQWQQMNDGSLSLANITHHASRKYRNTIWCEVPTTFSLHYNMNFKGFLFGRKWNRHVSPSPTLFCKTSWKNINDDEKG